MSRSNSEIPGSVLYGMDITLCSVVNMQCNHYQIYPHGKAATESYRILEMTRDTRGSQTTQERQTICFALLLFYLVSDIIYG